MADSLQPENKLIPGEPSKLETRSLKRLAACRTWKSYIELDVRECYFFSAPNRQRTVSSMTEPSTQRMLDAPELNTDIAFLIVQDFVTEVTNAFMPEALEWCERGPGMDLPAGQWDKIKKQIGEDDKKIFGAMKASNLYPEVTKAFYPDLAIGTVGMWVQRPHPSRPISVAAIPFRELEINLGPYGEIDDRFAVRYTRNSYVRELVGEEIWGKMDAELKKEIDEKPTTRTQVVWGFWRDWDDHTDESWQHVVLVSDKMVHDATLKGEGCCPLLVFRFNPTADWPHGVGPLIQGLPTFRQVDELERLRIKHSALSIAPPITYPDDSFVNVEQGVEEDMAYPVRPGTAQDVQPIYKVTPPDAANYQYEEKVKVLRKLFFVDMPEQHGDTPPTLGQWLDEMARAQRRIGTPGLPFWREGPANIFLRFKYLLEASGAIRPVQVDGRAIATLPRNPAQAAAEQQEVGMAVKALQIAGPTFPEEFKMAVDGEATMKAIFDKMRVTLIKFRNPDQKKAVMQQITQLSLARHVSQAPNETPGAAS
jgi:hypothetical protein